MPIGDAAFLDSRMPQMMLIINSLAGAVQLAARRSRRAISRLMPFSALKPEPVSLRQKFETDMMGSWRLTV
jgi:hypothetical protein